MSHGQTGDIQGPTSIWLGQITCKESQKAGRIPSMVALNWLGKEQLVVDFFVCHSLPVLEKTQTGITFTLIHYNPLIRVRRYCIKIEQERFDSVLCICLGRHLAGILTLFLSFFLYFSLATYYWILGNRSCVIFTSPAIAEMKLILYLISSCILRSNFSNQPEPARMEE